MKHHKIAQLVNALTEAAIKYKDCQCLRQKIHNTLGEYIDIKDDNDVSIIEEFLIRENHALKMGINSANEYLEIEDMEGISLDDQDKILRDFYIAKALNNKRLIK